MIFSSMHLNLNFDPSKSLSININIYIQGLVLMRRDAKVIKENKFETHDLKISLPRSHKKKWGQSAIK